MQTSPVWFIWGCMIIVSLVSSTSIAPSFFSKGGENSITTSGGYCMTADNGARTRCQLYLRATDGQLHGRPTNGHESRYLLTGFSAC